MFCKSTIFLLLLLPYFAFSQSVKTLSGKEFWFSFIENSSKPSRLNNGLGVMAISKKDCKLVVSIPAIPYTKAFALVANKEQFIGLPIALSYLESSEFNEKKGINISSSEPVRLTALLNGNFSRDQCMIIPWESIPNAPQYIVSSLQGDLSVPSEFCIVSAEDNTKIKITPTAETFNGRNKGVPFFVTLNKGIAYQVQALGNGNLDGSKVSVVESCKKISVFMGNMGAVSDRKKACPTRDLLMEQAIPLIYWGKEFVSVPSKNLIKGYIIKITASKTNTTIKVNGFADRIIANIGESIFYDIPNKQPVCISADNPVSTYQISRSFYCSGTKNELGDPSMVTLIPNKSRVKSTEVFFQNDPSPSEKYLCVIIPKGTFSYLKWNNAKPPNPISIESCGNFEVVHWELNNQLVKLSNDAGLLAYQFGYFKSEAFASAHGAQFRGNLVDIELNKTIFCGFQDELKGLVVSAKNNNIIWNYGDGNKDNGLRVKHKYTKPGKYILTVGIGDKDTLCGKDKVIDTINILPTPYFNFGSSDTTICTGEILTLKYLQKKGEKLKWEDRGKANERTIFTNTQAKLVVTDSNGCTHEDSINVKFDPCNDLKLFVYNAFTPGTDGKNDIWEISYEGYEFINVTIYNRWAQIMHKYTLPKGKHWNGKVNNQAAICPDGTYYYVLELKNNQTKNITNVSGSITLINEK